LGTKKGVDLVQNKLDPTREIIRGYPHPKSNNHDEGDWMSVK
jgi:hypothetical protein